MLPENITKLLGGTKEDMLIAHQLIIGNPEYLDSMRPYGKNNRIDWIIRGICGDFYIKSDVRSKICIINASKYSHLQRFREPIVTEFNKDILISYSGNLYWVKNVLK